jgi:ubiquinone/menaquinone biosynthesis C-methylase UbiE
MKHWRVIAGVMALGVAGSAMFLYAAFGAFLPWREEQEVRRLAGVAQVMEGQTIAEIGAGGGRFSFALAGIVGPTGRVLASELAGQKLDALAGRALSTTNVKVVAAEREQTGLPDGCCDLILMRNMFHHATMPDSFLASVKRALKGGGRVVIIDFEPGALWFHGGRPADAPERRSGHGVSQATVREEMTAAGFVLDHAEPNWSGPMWLSMFHRGQ